MLNTPLMNTWDLLYKNINDKNIITPSVFVYKVLYVWYDPLFMIIREYI
jgi:hypothetical protein